MKITNIKTYPIWVGHRNQFVLKIETDEGIIGWGESGLSGRELAVEGAVRHFREILLGQDPMQIGRIWQTLYRSQYFEGGRVLLAAQSAIDIALYDIKGKALGVPVYELLGGKQRDFIPCFTSSSATGERMIADIKALIADGWTTLRVFPQGGHLPTDSDDVFEPWQSIGETARWLTRLREEIGIGPMVGLDYHHRLSVAEATSLCQRLQNGTLDFLEEPIRDESPEAYAQLRRMTGVPFAIGEEFSSKWQFLPYIEQGLTNFARVDICNVGGFTEAMKVAGWAEAHYIDLMPHNPLGPICTAATIHLAAAVPNFTALEVWVPTDEGFDHVKDLYSDEIFPLQPKRQGTRFLLPTAPGLGVEFNERDFGAAQRTFKFWEPPHWRRRDGSVQNW
jgi:galactonate dehydratase